MLLSWMLATMPLRWYAAGTANAAARTFHAPDNLRARQNTMPLRLPVVCDYQRLHSNLWFDDGIAPPRRGCRGPSLLPVRERNRAASMYSFRPSAPAGASWPHSATRERILVVEDEAAIAELISTALGFVGYDVETVASGRQALAVIARFMPHLILLDVMLPDLDGFSVLDRLRSNHDPVPVIFLTARDAHDDMIRGLAHGGDDYITKPFRLDELVVRVQAVLRRSGSSSTATADAPRLRYADLVLDDTEHRVWRHEELINLSPTEFRLLRYLLQNADRVLTKAQMLEHVWQNDCATDLNVVETYISYLRRKVDTRDPRLIQTVRGVGYALRMPNGGSTAAPPASSGGRPG